MSENKEMEVVEQTIPTIPTPNETSSNQDEVVSFNFITLLQWILYAAGVILIIMAVVKYGADLETYKGEYRFEEVGYVGGDAYNFIISASRSAAVMVKSLVLAVLGCSSVISGLLLRISEKK